MPMLSFKRRQINNLTVGRDGHAIAATFIRFLPKQFVRGEIEAHQGAIRVQIEALRLCAGTDSFDIQWLAFFINPTGRNPSDELMSVLNTKHEDAMTAVLEIIPDAGLGHI